MLLGIKDLRGFIAVLLVASSCAILGCDQHDQIARYTVAKPELVDPTLVAKANVPAAAVAEQQTLGLIVPIGETSWFFKLTGDNAAVELQHDAFLQFVSSIKFSSGPNARPSWTLPEGWKELPGSQFRFATVRLPDASSGEKPLEISISTAGGEVLANINRWRGQLNLKPIAAGELAATTKSLQIDGHEATLVSLVGTGSGGMSGAPFAPFAGGSSLPADHPPLSSAKESTNAEILYNVPPEWTAAARNAFSLAAFRAADGDQQVEITVSSAGGDLLSNVNRWRGQIGVSPIDAAELASVVKRIDTLGVAGDYVELVSSESSAKRETILGVRADAGGRTWFIKLKGNAELAAREKPRFEAFVKSLKLP